MQTVAVLTAIFVGVAFAVYQVYDIYYAQNFQDDESLAQDGGKSAFARLKAAFPARVVAAAMEDEALSRNPQPLLRRRRSVVVENEIRIRYPGWIGRPVTHNWRQPLLVVVLIDCLLAMFLGGLSLYTVAYEVPGEAFAWMNDHVVVLLLLVLILLLTHVVARLDVYLHDIYRIGRLNRFLG
ncbi:hypothetical protein GCM10009038_00230 [Salinicola rhizosphaerae]|uniref:Uncharacterized protein n=2 Tax=Salinicola rhizosphaerae TaxID=1443141 RepID=A0ABQ3DLU0_9GAMM|nr:hypothetical protein GCM10009038_00230 [Salinicola rhizosphaerae]